MTASKPIAILVLLVLVATSSALGDDRDECLRQRTWKKHWKQFAGRCVEIDGEYFTCPRFNPKFKSSAHIDRKEYRKKNATRIRWTYRNKPSQMITTEAPTPGSAAGCRFWCD